MGICIISRFAFAGRFTGGGVPVTLSALHYPPMKRCSAAALFESSPCQHKKQTPCRDTARGLFFYGPGGIRTLDLSDANRTLSQLSYRPLCQFWGRDLGPRYVALALPAELRAHILFNSKHYSTVFQKNPVLFFIFRNFLYAKRADRFGPTLFSQIIRLFCRS